MAIGGYKYGSVKLAFSSTRLSAADRQAIAQGLLDGLDEEALVARFGARALPPALVRSAIGEARGDPYFQLAERAQARVRKYEWTLSIPARLAAEDPAALEVPTVHAVDPDRFYGDYYYANRPVKLTGLVDHWLALERWSLDYFASRIGEVEVELQRGRQSSPDYELVKERHQSVVPFPGVIEALRTCGRSNDFYLTAYNSGVNKTALQPLWDDLGPVSILAPLEERDGFLWLGPQGTLTPFHHDLTNNLLVQVLGRKRVKLVAAHDAPLMRNHLHCFSAWPGDALEPGPASDDKPSVLETVIAPGDALFLPVGWWHHVEALDLSASMSFTSFRGANDFHGNYRSNGPL